MIVAGIDWGRHNDWTSVVRLNGRMPPHLVIDRFLRVRHQTWNMIVGRVLPVVAGCQRILSDGTGVGDALTDRIPRAVGVAITGSDGTSSILRDNRISLGTNELFRPLIQAIASGVLISGKPEPILEDELKDFVVTFTKKGKPQFHARRGNDDTVFALALAVYAAIGGSHVLKEVARTRGSGRDPGGICRGIPEGYQGQSSP